MDPEKEDKPKDSGESKNPQSAIAAAAAERRKKLMELKNQQTGLLASQNPPGQQQPFQTPQQQSSEVMRLDLIQKAVQFLSNPSVRDTPLSRKLSFLREKKGLSQMEIEEACRLSNTDMNEAARPIAPNYAPPSPAVPYQISAPPVPKREERGGLGWTILLATVAAVGVGGFATMLTKVIF